MSLTYGSTSGFSVTTSKNFERLIVLDKDGALATGGNIVKYTRTETTTETVGSTFGAPTIGNLDVLDATIVFSVDETIIDPSTAGAAPPAARTYNPRAEATATVLGDFTGATFSLDSITFTTDSHEKSATAGDVVKTTLRGTAYGSAGGLTVGSISSGSSTIREEKRFSNTDFLRTVATTVSFSGS
jgi:hypothetical protein